MSYFFDANFMNAKNCKFDSFWNINFSDFSSYLQSYLTYRSVIYLKLKLKTFYFDLIFSHFWLESMFYEKGSVEVVSFFLFQTLVTHSWKKIDLGYFCTRKFAFSINSLQGRLRWTTLALWVWRGIQGGMMHSRREDAFKEGNFSKKWTTRQTDMLCAF